MVILHVICNVAQNVDCGKRNEYPDLCFYVKNKKISIFCKPQFYNIKMGYKRVYIT